MKRLHALALVALLAQPAAAVDDRTPEQVLADQQAVTRYYLAAAEAEGDVLSDAYVLKLLALSAGDEEAQAGFDPALLARLDLARARLGARVDAARNNDPVLLASQLRCHPAARTSPECGQDLARLAELAGDNGYHHFVLMGKAWAREDAEGFLRHARLAAEAPGFEPDVDAVFRAVYARLKQVPDDLAPRPEGESGNIPAAGMLATSVAAAFALPNYQHYVQPCREAEGELRGHCLAIADRLLDESSVAIDIYIAQSIYRAVGDSDGEARAQARRDRLGWQTQAVSSMEQRFDRHQWQAYFDAWAEGGELAAFAYAAEAMGLPANPPPDWSPETPL